MSEEQDPELAAIAVLLKTLQPLKEDQRARVINFIFQKLGMTGPFSRAQERDNEVDTDFVDALRQKPKSTPNTAKQFSDIRSLKENKNPRTASQMVALVAYYLEQLAPQGERREFITADDIKPYFNQAGFELPSAPPAMTLTHAKNAGYLNALSRGQYRLNPVGHNLVAYKLPTDVGERANLRRTRKTDAKKKKSKRRARKPK